eukprot:13705413-Alexandrium_andersonii.AAC.1
MPRRLTIEQLAGPFRLGAGRVQGWISRGHAAREAYLRFGPPEAAGRALVERADQVTQGRFLEVFRASREEALGLGG